MGSRIEHGSANVFGAHRLLPEMQQWEFLRHQIQTEAQAGCGHRATSALHRIIFRCFHDREYWRINLEKLADEALSFILGMQRQYWG